MRVVATVVRNAQRALASAKVETRLGGKIGLIDTRRIGAHHVRHNADSSQVPPAALRALIRTLRLPANPTLRGG